MPSLATVRRLTKRKVFRRRFGGPAFAGGEVLPVTFPATPLTARVYIALGADLTASHLTWNWLDITEHVRFDQGISFTVGRRDEASRVNASRASLKLGNQDGRFTRRNPTSPYFGLLSRNTPIWVQVNPGSGFVDRYFGFINEWPNRWADQSGSDTFVTIQCAGVLRRLAQGEVAQPALRRAILTSAPSDYWPLNDDAESAFGAPAVAGGDAMRSASPDTPQWAQTQGPTGEPGLVVRLADTNADSIPASLAANCQSAATTSWAAEMCFYQEGLSGSALDGILIKVQTSNYEWILFAQTAPLLPMQLDIQGLTSGQAAAQDGFEDAWHHVVVTAVQSGPNVEGKVYYDGALAISVSAAGTLTAPARAELNIAIASTNFGLDMSACHVAVYDSADSVNVADHYQAFRAGVGEQAHSRIARLCREANVPVMVGAGRSAAMGAQGSGALLDLLRECEEADLGVLYEHEFGLAYQASSERYNQPSVMTLDFGANHIVMPAPSDDDQRLRNEWTVSLPDGSDSATYRDKASVAADGLYDDSKTVNVAAAAQLANNAAMRVALGIVDEDRWPKVPVYLHRHPDLIAAWVAARIGNRLTIANPPDQMVQHDINVVLEGWDERIDQKTWQIAPNLSPGTLYSQIGVYGTSPTVARYDSANSFLAAAYSDSDTTLSVTTDAGHACWITSAAFPTQFPFDINVEGIRLTVTDITSTTSPQAFTVTRSVDGYDKALSSGAQVRLWTPARYGL